MERSSFLDLLITTLCEHEKALSELIDKLERTIENLKPTQPNGLEQFRVSECGEVLMHTLMFLDEKGLLTEFKDYLRKVRT